MASDEHRIEMLRRAISPDDRFVLDLREFERPGLSYSVQTLESFAGDDPNAELFFLMGEDSLADFPTWRQPERILQLARLAVACRPGTDVEPGQIEGLFPHSGGRVVMVETPELEISSSLIRARRRRGDIIRYLVSDGVDRYIHEHRLYETD
jgi:nicotinate-nucleotide adenylyltransferase